MSEDEIDCEELSKIVKQSIQKYFPLEKGDLRLYGIDDESSFVKKNFHKVINLHKNRIKSISTIKKLYLHCTMGILQNINGVSSGVDGIEIII